MSIARLKFMGIRSFDLGALLSLCNIESNLKPLLIEELFVAYLGNVSPWPLGEEIESVECKPLDEKKRASIVEVVARSKTGKTYRLMCADMVGAGVICFPSPCE